MNKKILIIINNLGIGGAERLVVDEIHELIRVGADVTLITLAPESSKSFVFELQLPAEKRILVRCSSLFNIFSLFKLARTIQATNPDLVITQLWFANTVGKIAAKIAGVPTVISFEQNVYDSIKTWKMFFADRVLQHMTTKIIAVSDVVKESLIRHGIRGEKIDVLYNSIDTSKFEKEKDPMYFQKEFGLPENSFVFIFVGRLIHQKAIDVLIDAFKKVGDSYLVIAGQGKEHDFLKEKVRELDLRSQIVFAGVRNDISELLLASDCFVLPSRYEGLPLVLTEACAAGKPIIVSDFEAAKEVIDNEHNGLIVPREDSEALAAAMNRILQDEALRTKLSAAAKKTSEKFSISNHVRAILRYANLAV